MLFRKNPTNSFVAVWVNAVPTACLGNESFDSTKKYHVTEAYRGGYRVVQSTDSLEVAENAYILGSERDATAVGNQERFTIGKHRLRDGVVERLT